MWKVNVTYQSFADGTYIANSCQRLIVFLTKQMKFCGLPKLCVCVRMYVMYVCMQCIYFHVQEYSFFLSHQGLFVTLACTKHGSRSLDAIWDAATLKQKILIMDELSTKEPILNSDQYGSIMSSKYYLSLYKHTPNEWKDLQGKEFRKKKLFADIIGDSNK